MSSLAIDLHPAGVAPVAPRRRGGHLRLVGAQEHGPVVPALRITRRGRLALTGTVSVVLALALVAIISAMGPAGATGSYVVEPGMTLSQIAAEQMPGRPLSQAITDLQQANNLSTSTIAAGQELIIPAP